MLSSAKPTTVGVLLSGGLDSCILLHVLAGQGHRIHPIYIQGDLLWQREEMLAVVRLLHAAHTAQIMPLVTLRLPLADLYNGHWSVTGRGVPDAASPDSAVQLPGWNSLLTVKAALWCQLHDVPVLALATLRGNPFADSTAPFFAHLQQALELSEGKPIALVRPFAHFDKARVMQLGRRAPLELTFSCLAPVGGLHCGRCNKCAERRRAFETLPQGDPTRYADATMLAW